MKPDIHEQIDEQMKVCRQFKNAAPKMVQAGRITQAQADTRIERQQAVLKSLQYIATHRDAFMKAVKDG